MCVIEAMGYSEENRLMYCRNCIIFRKTGKCEYLRYLESKVTADLTKDSMQEICISDCGL
jgi:late competence protein required for DNA uptake (superfamily II DNA/RNA helicase)